MKAIDFLKQHAEILRTMNKAGLKYSSIAHVEIFEEYRRLVDAGESSYKVVMQLSIIHGVSERTIYRIIETMQSEV